MRLHLFTSIRKNFVLVFLTDKTIQAPAILFEIHKKRSLDPRANAFVIGISPLINVFQCVERVEGLLLYTIFLASHF